MGEDLFIVCTRIRHIFGARLTHADIVAVAVYGEEKACVRILYGEAGGAQTESGAQLARDTAGRLMELENRIYASWTPEEQALFLRLNRDFAEKLTALVREEL